MISGDQLCVRVGALLFVFILTLAIYLKKEKLLRNYDQLRHKRNTLGNSRLLLISYTIYLWADVSGALIVFKLRVL